MMTVVFGNGDNDGLVMVQACTMMVLTVLFDGTGDDALVLVLPLLLHSTISFLPDVVMLMHYWLH
jgi:hypothetical protein